MLESKSINDIKYVLNPSQNNIYPEFLSLEAAKEVQQFHKTMAEYKETPLVELKMLATKLKVNNIFVKDESFRFDLNAFKALGGTYAVAKIICEKLNIDIKDASFKYFNSPEILPQIKDMVFVTATDGNHGRGLAWAVNKMGCKSVVYMPKGSSNTRLQAIIDAGADASITDLNYDDAVRLATKMAEENDWILVQDTAWEGYENIPNWITQGYSTMALESFNQLKEKGFQGPTHIFLQAGVGSMAGSVLGFYANVLKEQCPKVVIMEAHNANCIYKSILLNDGNPHAVEGDLQTIMAGLACGEANPVTWEVIKNFAFASVSCPDPVSAHGSRVLANPIEPDKRVISGESGSLGIGLVSVILENDTYKVMKDDLGLNEDSIILCFNTEGDTDPESYKQIIEDGLYPIQL